MFYIIVLVCCIIYLYYSGKSLYLRKQYESRKENDQRFNTNYKNKYCVSNYKFKRN